MEYSTLQRDGVTMSGGAPSTNTNSHAQFLHAVIGQLIARPLGTLRMINTASPAYLARFGMPQSLDSLLNHGYRMVHYQRNFGLKPDGWVYPDRDSYKTLMLPGAMRVNSVPA